jgi:hypothetical protein
MIITISNREIEFNEKELISSDVFSLLSSIFLGDQVGAGKGICDKYFTKESLNGLTNWELVSLYNKLSMSLIESSADLNPKFTDKGDNIEIDFTNVIKKDFIITISKNFDLENCMKAIQTMVNKKPIEAGFALFDMEASKYPRYNEVTAIMSSKPNGSFIAALTGLNMCNYISIYELDVKKN